MASSCEIVYMNLVATNQNMVQQNTAIKFDNIKASPRGIKYEDVDNSVLFTEGGIYFVSWWISLMDVSGADVFSTAILNQNNDFLAAASVATGLTSGIRELSLKGNHLLEFSKGDRIRLVNFGGGTFQLLRENGYSGAMVITKIPDSRVYGAVKNNAELDTVGQGDVINMDTIELSSMMMYGDGIFTIVESGKYFVAWMADINSENIFMGNLQFGISFIRKGIPLLTSGVQGIGAPAIQIIEGSGIVELEVGDRVGIYNLSDTDLSFKSAIGRSPLSFCIFKL